MKARSTKVAILALSGALAVLVGSGCGVDDGRVNVTDDPVSTEGATGSIGLDLRVGNVQIDSFTYHISGNQLDRSGDIDVSQSNGITATIGNIPFGSDYTLTLSGHSTGEPPPTLTCTGSAKFDVQTPDVTPVSVSVSCREMSTSPVPVPWFANVAFGVALLGLGAALLKNEPPRRKFVQ